MNTKEEQYRKLLPAARSLMSGDEDGISRMANLSALLHQEFGFWWTGFYRVIDEGTLLLGPFQGPVACTKIRKGKGVCGTAWAEDRTVIVPDVSEFPGHIACSSESRSEIVVPVRSQGRIVAVLDIDSRETDTFDSTDARYLEELSSFIFGTQREIWFAAGCFWGAQKFFKMIKGVGFTEVGFANGWKENPTYKEVYTDKTGHAECVHLKYNPDIVSLNELVRLYFKIIDPLSLNRQGEDEGTRYRTGVYYKDERDLEILSKEFSAVESELGEKIAVELLPLNHFYKAEEYHQDYLDKTPGGYCHLSPGIFKFASGFNRKKELLSYLNEHIIPQYREFDRAHSETHVNSVMHSALEMSRHYDTDDDMIAAAAAFHDIGLGEDRATHHLISGRVIREDKALPKWFTAEQIETIAQAAEDHRASSDHEPRSIYGKIIAEADRQINPEQVIRRTIQFSLAHYPQYGKEEHWKRTQEHLKEKYAEGGYLKLWIPESDNAVRLKILRAIIKDEQLLRDIFDRIYQESQL